MKRLLALVSAGFFLTACQVPDSSTQAVPGTSDISAAAEVTATPIPLPIDNRFPNRWNDSNNGSTYEPCIAFSANELRAFGIDPESLEDAALVDGQGTRGCNWFTRDAFGFGQVVTNSRSLEDYKKGTPEYDWRPDLEFGGRLVGLFSPKFEDSGICSTYVQSGRAAVVTNVVASKSKQGRTLDPCRQVQDFTSAYIDKIPE